MSTSHRSISELFLTFFSGEVIPHLVEETIRMHKKGESSKDIISELSKGLIETTTLGKNAKKSPQVQSSSKTHSWVSIDEYLQNHEQENVCTYVNSKGDQKDKICCRELPADHDLSGERDKFRCTVHKRGQSQRTVSALLRDFKQDKTKASSTSDTQRIAKIKSSLNDSKTEVSRDESSGTSSVEKKARSATSRPSFSTFSGKGESIAEKVRRKNEEHQKRTHITIESEASESRENSVERSIEKTSKPPRSITKERSKTPPSDKQTDTKSTNDKDQTDAKADDEQTNSKPENDAKSADDEDYPVPVTVDHPSASKYTWMQFSHKEFLILLDDVTITCYGVYYTETPHNHEEVLRLPSSWRELIKSPQGSSLQYLSDNDIKVEKL